jgi:site-specific DNA-methyltransferase (adenine-specific)
MQITPYTKNAKKHPKKQIEQVAASIKEFGMNQPIVVDKQGVIIVGHGRYEALQSLGMEIKDEYIKVVDLTEEQAKAYRLADNKLNESEWDMALVIEELKDLSEPMLDLTGFDKDLIIEADEADDEVPDVPEEPQSKLGDLYELGKHRVLCGSATEIADIETLVNDNKIDLVFTDPPYGMSVVKGNKVGADFGVAKKGQYSDVIGDDTIETAQDFYNACIGLGYERFILWGGNYFISFLPFSTGWLIWDKRGDSGIKNTFADGEMAWTNIQKQVRIYKQLWNGMIREGEKGKRVHPTQKPIMTLEKMINDFSDSNSIILDAFLGSGSTLIASEKTGRICYGMELDPKYVDVIVQRYVDYTGNATIKKNGQEIIWKKTVLKTK